VGCERRDGAVTRKVSTLAGGVSTERLRMSGQTATSTPLMHPAATSRITHDPSLPSSPTDPDIPLAFACGLSCADRISVSASQVYSTSGGGESDAGSSCTAIFITAGSME